VACSDYPRYSGTAARNGEPFGELGLVLQHDAAWHQQSGPPFNEMPENLGGTGIDVQKTANVRPFASSGTCDYVNASAACTASANLSLPNGAGANLPSGTNTPGSSAVPFVVTGAPGATVTYTFAEGASYTVTGTGVIGPTGTFASAVNLSAFPDGTITVTILETGGGAPNRTITGTVGKNSVAPPAPSVSAAAYVNLASESTYNITVTGQAGSIATVVITDAGVPVPGLSNGMDFVGSGGSVVIPVDVSALLDGQLTISVTLTNGAGDSSATTVTVTKDTIPPPLSMTVPPYVNNQNVGAFPLAATGEKLDPLTYTITDGTSTISGSSKITGDGTWTTAVSLSKLKSGLITITLTETDAAGNVTTRTATVTKNVATPATPTVALNAASDSGASNSDYITNVSAPAFTTTGPAGATVTVYVNGVAYTGQHLADGKYTVTASATDAYGNVSAVASAPKTLVIVTAPPSGSFTVSGAKTIGGQLTTGSASPSLTLSFSDLGGISTMAISTNGGTSFGPSQAYATSAAVSLAGGQGIYTIVVKLVDVAGNTSTYTQTVRLDTIAPTISASLSAPQQTIGYDGTANITATYSATDISGVSSLTAKLDGASFSASTINIYTLAAGTHTLIITAIDGIGNTGTTTLTFSIHPSLVGVEDLVLAGYGAHAYSSSVETTLLGYLTSTANSVKTNLTNFINAVSADSKSKVITAAEAALLTSWAQDLYNRS
jgi:hypothetical protein